MLPLIVIVVPAPAPLITSVLPITNGAANAVNDSVVEDANATLDKVCVVEACVAVAPTSAVPVAVACAVI